MRQRKRHNTFSGRPVVQKEKEITDFINLINDKECVSYLEVGSKYGDTFYRVMKSLPKGSSGVAVDLVDGEWGRSDSAQYLEAAAAQLRKEGYNVKVIFGDSTNLDVIKQVKEFSDNFDCILLDGDHRYKGIKSDFDNYNHFANKLVAFHDIDTEGYKQIKNPEMVFGVAKLWNELKETYSTTHEFIDNQDNERNMGIGVLEK